ncbi:MAG TPA: alkaline phosphatase family protein [Streptosporangiaceae bacterium]|nr:alkaline phosphatase family protein [Streptosporangiaceae bacterium]
MAVPRPPRYARQVTKSGWSTTLNGIPNFANLQTSPEFATQVPYGQLSTDLAAGRVPNISYIILDECHDMQARPWCTDSGRAGDAHDNWLVATGDAFVGSTVTQISSSAVWQSGNNAIVVTFDEGNTAQSQIATIVTTNHGPRGVADNTSYNHYLLASLEQAFGLGCLQNACAANPMTPLSQVTGSTSVPAAPGAVHPAAQREQLDIPDWQPGEGHENDPDVRERVDPGTEPQHRES